MSNIIDEAIAKNGSSECQVSGGGAKALREISEACSESQNPMQRHAAERNMQIVITTLSATQREMKATMLKMRSIKKKTARRK